MNNTKIPTFVAPFLWSYDFKKFDIRRDKNIIIQNVLNFGSEKATNWLRSVYDIQDIKEVIISTPVSAWNKKSLALWSLVFGVSPMKATRFT